MNVFPLSNYPGTTQEALLNQLLRKKLEPGVEDWVAKGLDTARKAGMEQESVRNEFLELWSWAGVAANELARGHEWGGEYTKEEREIGIENIMTGLRRGLNEDEEDEEAEIEEDEMEFSDDKIKSQVLAGQENGKDADGIPAPSETGNPLPLEQILKFMATGVEPQR